MLELALYCSVIAYVYAGILVKPGHLLHFWVVWMEKLLVKEVIHPDYQRKEHWLYKPVIGCELCVTGQLALWSSIIIGFRWYQVIIICSAAILITLLIKGIIKKLYE